MLHCTSFIDRLPVSLVTVKKAPPLGDKREGRIKIRGVGRGGVGDGGAGGARRLIISCSGWAHQRRQTSTGRPRPGGRSLPRCPSASWVGSAGGSSDPAGGKEERKRSQDYQTDNANLKLNKKIKMEIKRQIGCDSVIRQIRGGR